MSVIISPRAEKDFKKLPKVDQIAIAKKIRSLSSLSPSAETKLSGYKDIYQRLQQLWR